MRRAAAALAALLPALAGAPGAAAGVLAAACAGPGAAEVLLLPEDLGALEASGPGRVAVTGAYTATDRREGGLPKPVGVFLRAGARVSLELGRMDGVLVVGADGAARIATVDAAPLGGRVYDLRPLGGRVAFAEAAARLGASALQSHLLIRDGALDLRPVADAPEARRRALLQDAVGRLLLWESAGPRTLYAAAVEMLAAHAPRMALNLDMGSFDFCERRGEGGAEGCGLVGREGLARLSNLLILSDDPACRPGG